MPNCVGVSAQLVRQMIWLIKIEKALAICLVEGQLIASVLSQKSGRCSPCSH